MKADWLWVLTAGMGKAKLGAAMIRTNWVSGGTSMENWPLASVLSSSASSFMSD